MICLHCTCIYQGIGTDTDQDEDGQRKGVTVTFDRPPDPSLIDNATYIDAVNYFCDMMVEKQLEAMRAPGKRVPGSKENVVQAKNTVLVLPKIPQYVHGHLKQSLLSVHVVIFLPTSTTHNFT